MDVLLAQAAVSTTAIAPVLFLSMILWAILLAPVVIWASQRTAVAQATLKLEMVRRGMSAEEIKMVMECGGGPKTVVGDHPPAKPVAREFQPILHGASQG